jgi:hypothetical protein
MLPEGITGEFWNIHAWDFLYPYKVTLQNYEIIKHCKLQR